MGLPEYRLPPPMTLHHHDPPPLKLELGDSKQVVPITSFNFLSLEHALLVFFNRSRIISIKAVPLNVIMNSCQRLYAEPFGRSALGAAPGATPCGRPGYMSVRSSITESSFERRFAR